MPENKTPAAPAAEPTPAAPEVAEVDLKSLPTAEYLTAIGGGFQDDSSTITDVDTFDASVNVIVESMGVSFTISKEVDKAVGKQTVIRTKIAAAIIACRLACVFQTKDGPVPDTFGNSDAYRTLYQERIVGAILTANPKLTDQWVKGELKAVRTGYIDDSGTRAKGMLLETIIRDAVVREEVPGATLAEDGTVTIPVMTKDKGTGEMVQAVKVKKDEAGNIVKDKDGNSVKIPQVMTYKPGQKDDVPGVIKAIVKETVALDRKDKAGKTMTKVPKRFGGASKPTGGGGDRPKTPEAWNELYRNNWLAMGQAITKVNSLTALSWAQAGMTTVVDTINSLKGVTNAEAHALVLDMIAGLAATEAAILRQTKTPDDLAPFRYVPTDDTTLPAPVPTPEAEETDEDDAEAADNAAAA